MEKQNKQWHTANDYLSIQRFPKISFGHESTCLLELQLKGGRNLTKKNVKVTETHKNHVDLEMYNLLRKGFKTVFSNFLTSLC